MLLHFNGSYHDNDRLPHEELKKHKYAVKFKEFSNTPLFLLSINLCSFVILGILSIIFHLLAGINNISICGILLVICSLFPHEIIHASFFKSNVYLFTHQLALIITGDEPMSRRRFIMMTLLPTIIFGFIPFLIFLVNPSFTVLGTLGGISISLGLGDLYNIFNCITQVPKNGYCFMDKQNTYWFIPREPKKVKVENKTSSASRLFALVSHCFVGAIIIIGLFNIENISLVIFMLLIELSFFSLCGFEQIRQGG